MVCLLPRRQWLSEQVLVGYTNPHTVASSHLLSPESLLLPQHTFPTIWPLPLLQSSLLVWRNDSEMGLNSEH